MIQEGNNCEMNRRRLSQDSEAQEVNGVDKGGLSGGNLLAPSDKDPHTVARSDEVRLHQLLSSQTEHDLGQIRPITNVQTTLPLGHIATHAVRYPRVVVEALFDLFAEYNQNFRGLVEANREFTSDYRFAVDAHGCPVNSFVQIDMLGLSPEFLSGVSYADKDVVKAVLRRAIFEIENSLAMYQLLERSFVGSVGPSVFSLQFRRALDDIRRQHGRPIVLLAVTDEKLEVMRACEFGKYPGELLTSDEVRDLSGFDDLFGPRELQRHLANNGGQCVPLLYVRSSDPPLKLRNPKVQVSSELLENSELRRVMKENSITFNIDAPGQIGDARINDTKAYLEPMGMAFKIRRSEELMTSDGKLADTFSSYLREIGVDPDSVARGEFQLRAKPLRGTYGCYGHIRGALQPKFLRKLREEVALRGEYVVQPELTTPTVINKSDGKVYTYIDRNFLSCTGGEMRFLGGVRTLMSVDSTEAQKGRIHGSNESIYQQVY